MISIRTAEEIELLRESNLLVSKTLGELKKLIRPGVTTNELDKFAEEYIRDNNAKPGFLGFNGYPKTLCTSVNEQVVHGIPSDYVIKEGDIVSIDCGVLKNGYYGDTAYTFNVGEVKPEVQKLLQVTRESLLLGVQAAVHGARVGDVGFTIQQYCEDAGYSVVRELVGHGLGTNMHEAPEVPNYGKRGRGPKLEEGMVICIEPMINMGKKEIIQENDGWTIRTRDRMPSAHFELAIAIRKGEPDVLSTFNYIEQ
ncbi:MAG: type I methionyl aminopeptidase [Bacteroidales bacterium]|nr:type I methionyl aminopeptidase [Bacteroidales bacterium]MBN2818439.1 type I methionyl aminopeptidase [Bacteroidales bacterium]